jgi:hypothetical protein
MSGHLGVHIITHEPALRWCPCHCLCLLRVLVSNTLIRTTAGVIFIIFSASTVALARRGRGEALQPNAQPLRTLSSWRFAPSAPFPFPHTVMASPRKTACPSWPKLPDWSLDPLSPRAIPLLEGLLPVVDFASGPPDCR